MTEVATTLRDLIAAGADSAAALTSPAACH